MNQSVGASMTDIFKYKKVGMKKCSWVDKPFLEISSPYK